MQQDPSTGLCFFAIMGDNPFWILGDTFLCKFYSVYNKTSKQVGFATAITSSANAPSSTQYKAEEKTPIKLPKALLPQHINRVQEADKIPASKDAIKEKIGKLRNSLEELVDLMEKQD